MVGEAVPQFRTVTPGIDDAKAPNTDTLVQVGTSTLDEKNFRVLADKQDKSANKLGGNTLPEHEQALLREFVRQLEEEEAAIADDAPENAADQLLGETYAFPRRQEDTDNHALRKILHTAHNATKRNADLFIRGDWLHEPGINFRQHLIQARTLLKSALLNNPTSLHFHIFAEDYYRFYLGQFLYQSRQLRRFDFMYTFYNFTYALTSDVTTTNNTRAGRALELRALEVLYLPVALPGIERVLYLDSGSLVLGPLDEMWAVFDTLDPVQSVSMAYNPWLVDDHASKK